MGKMSVFESIYSAGGSAGRASEWLLDPVFQRRFHAFRARKHLSSLWGVAFAQTSLIYNGSLLSSWDDMPLSDMSFSSGSEAADIIFDYVVAALVTDDPVVARFILVDAGATAGNVTALSGRWLTFHVRVSPPAKYVCITVDPAASSAVNLVTGFNHAFGRDMFYRLNHLLHSGESAVSVDTVEMPGMYEFLVDRL